MQHKCRIIWHMIAHYQLIQIWQYGYPCWDLFKIFPKPIEDLIGKKGKIKSQCVELEEIKEYATEDADIVPKKNYLPLS
jgi:hypothetical protein